MDRTERHTNYPNLFRSTSLIHYLLVIFHWNGCLYHIIYKNNGFGSKNWVFSDSETADVVKQYLQSYYWCTLALTTIGDLPRYLLIYLYALHVCYTGRARKFRAYTPLIYWPDVSQRSESLTKFSHSHMQTFIRLSKFYSCCSTFIRQDTFDLVNSVWNEIWNAVYKFVLGERVQRKFCRFSRRKTYRATIWVLIPSWPIGSCTNPRISFENDAETRGNIFHVIVAH